MKLINRGFITIQPTSHFFEWANSFETEFELSQFEDPEPNVYLITEDFLEIEPVIEQNFKRIFKSELSMITENEEDWPENLSLDNFKTWFKIQVGSTVFDLDKSDLRGEKI